MTTCNSYGEEKSSTKKECEKRIQERFYLVWDFMNNLYHRRERPPMDKAER